MKIIFLSAAFLATVSCVLGKLDTDCTSDRNCSSQENEACVNNKCKCSISYRPNFNQACVHVLGTSCQADDDCENMPGATCENFKCVCSAGWLLGEKECNKIGRDGDECTQHSDCIQRITPPDDNKECRDRKCICKSNYHEGSDKRCRKTIGLEETCSQNDDCYQEDSQHNNSLECKDTNEGKICKCKAGYKQEGDRCNGSAAKFIFSTSSLLLLAVTILKL